MSNNVFKCIMMKSIIALSRTLPAYNVARDQHEENFQIKYNIYKQEPGEFFLSFCFFVFLFLSKNFFFAKIFFKLFLNFFLSFLTNYLFFRFVVVGRVKGSLLMEDSNTPWRVGRLVYVSKVQWLRQAGKYSSFRSKFRFA